VRCRVNTYGRTEIKVAESAKCAATKFGGAWRFQAKIAGDLDWTYYDRPLLEDLLTLKEILVRKYQRRRASIEDVASLDKLIQEQGAYD
jgi:hypothetical protein